MNPTTDPQYLLEFRKLYGNRIRQIREENRQTQQQLADQIGMSCIAISNIEDGNLNFGIDTLTLLALHLDFSLFFLTKSSKDKLSSVPASTILRTCHTCKKSKYIIKVFGADCSQFV